MASVKPLLLLIFVTFVDTLPLMRMRLCIASTDPSRLQSQCVLCHNRRFKMTIRQCTGGNYLPANVSVDEGYCMLRLCRAQMPLVPPTPINALPGQNTIPEVNAEALYSGNGGLEQYQNHFVRPTAIRPPATIHIGNPMRPGIY